MIAFLSLTAVILLIGLLVWTMYINIHNVCESFNAMLECRINTKDCLEWADMEGMSSAYAERFLNFSKSFRKLMWSNIAILVASWLIFGIDCWLLYKLCEILISVIL